MLMETIFEQARAFLDAEPAINGSWLSHTFKIPPNKAQECLSHLKQHETDLHASYLVQGEDKQGSVVFKVVTEDKLEEVKQMFARIYREDLYSLYKTSMDADTLANCIVETNLNIIDRLFRETSVEESRGHSFLYNAFSTVCPPQSSLHVKPLGERFLSTMNKANGGQSNVYIPPAKPIAESSQASAYVPAAKAVTQSKPFFKTSEKAAEAIASVPPSTPSTALPTSTTAASVASPVKAVGSNKLKKRPVSKDDSEEEWSDGEGKKDKPTATTSAKQLLKSPVKTSAVKVTSKPPKKKGHKEEDDEESDDNENEEDNKGGPKKKRAKKNFATHGAMDDYMEDAAIEQHNRDVANPTMEKKKVRKLVEKTFQDDKGFFVTEMVYEDVSEDEGAVGGVGGVKVSAVGGGEKENAENKEAPKVIAKSAAMDKSKGTAKKAAAASGVQQKSMMSFFTKK
ncbi:hypothetical protein EON65_17290 [archaeon]|nr:MAG: hypothetical protein EON65_17290 [archaeon]